eukprot:TRINITY_DN67615_c8_g1_i2.p4 TRINITY_DN67615_c8_g1~~TRINITY_DN67615_c8_g1_i2.p4  ORF type:complete len:160 (+),score=33.14 TRINITY_DN67615_c8_g1_i2:778-1257(+)
MTTHSSTAQLSYFVLGGIVFVDLYMGYLMEWGDWYRVGPRQLVNRATADSIYQKNPDQRVVVPASVLMSNLTKGYGDFLHAPVKKFNGEEVNNLYHFVELWRNNTEEFVQIEFLDKRLMLLPYTEVNEKTPDIMKKYGVPAQGSPDVLELLEGPDAPDA